MACTGVVRGGPSGRGGGGPDDAECRRRRGRACVHTTNTCRGGPARPVVLGGAPPRCRPSPSQRRPKVDPVAPPSVAPHVPASVGRSHRSHGTGGQCCVTRRGQLCLPLTPPNR